MSKGKYSLVLELLVTLALIQYIAFSLCNGDSHPTIHCLATEREALIEFKEGIKDLSNRLSSWIGEDCCLWEGISCDNRTSHVIRLNLRNPHPPLDPDGLPYNQWSLGGTINPALLALEHLRYLDLSMNYFDGIPIPQFLGSMHELRYLNLSSARFTGTVPYHLGNLSSLQHLDLSNLFADEESLPPLSVDDAQWLSRLTYLQHLDMSFVDFKNAPSWLQPLNMLPDIRVIRLHGCGFDSIPLSLLRVNFTSLSVLDLSGNARISSTLPVWLFSVSSLEYLDLSGNNFYGHIPAGVGNWTSIRVLDLYGNSYLEGELPEALGSLCKLEKLFLYTMNISKELIELEAAFSGCIRYSLEELNLASTQLGGYLPDWLGDLQHLRSLELSGNLLYGSIPDSLGMLSSLQGLHLADNGLNGTVTESLGRLSEVVDLDLSNNLLKGTISEAHFTHLAKLKHLDLSNNSLVLKVTSDWVPSFQLETIAMQACRLGPRFPVWLRTQRNYSMLDMSNAGVTDTMPDWFWNLSTNVFTLDVSHNEIFGEVPHSLNLGDNDYLSIDLSYNYFSGTVPHISSNVVVLDLSNNLFSGPIPQQIGKWNPELQYLSLSENDIDGHISSTLCKLMMLSVLDLSKNNLSGEIPNCWKNSSSLQVLNLSHNNLSGWIPDSFRFLNWLESLHLSNNHLSGELPASLKNCNNMVVLDLSYNKFTGGIPRWIGENLLNLVILSLRSNTFCGKIPFTLPSLTTLQILDLSHNNLSGNIPRSFGNFTAMMLARTSYHVSNTARYYAESLTVTIKGRTVEFDRLLSLVIAMDLSDNNLSGTIPDEIANLSGMQSLNLSENHLTGKITQKVGRLRELESLDLSRNDLSGEIPSTLSNLSFLGFLNLSYNNLTGRIPSDNHLDTFDLNSYMGNPNLCGFPLSIKCQGDETTHGQKNGSDNEGEKDEDEDEDEDEMLSLYLSMGLGFVVGLWAIYMVLLLKKTWRDAYFCSIDSMYDRIYVIAKVYYARLKREMTARKEGLFG